MNFRFLSIELLCVGLLGIPFISNAQQLGPDALCLLEPENPTEQCSEEHFEEIRNEFAESLNEIQIAYDDLDCEDLATDDEKYEGCQNLNEAVCSIEEATDNAIKSLTDACKDTDAADANLQKAMVAFAALPPDVELEVCITTAQELKLQQLQTDQIFTIAISSLGHAINALEFVADGAEAIPLFGNAASLPLHNDIGEASIKDGTCGAKQVTYIQKLLEETYNFVETRHDRTEGKIDVIDTTLDRTEGKIDVIAATLDRAEGKVDVIDTNVDDNQLILEFLQCRFEYDDANRMTTFIGGGCDGIDNDCDSNVLDTFGDDRTAQPITFRIDECDEDLVPPTITLAREPPETFTSQEEAEAWFRDNTVVSDDCAPLQRLRKSIDNPGTAGEVTIRVVDTRCEKAEEIVDSVNGGEQRVVDGPGEYIATRTFSFIIDGDAPTVTCGFHKLQDVDFAGETLEALGDHSDPLFIDFIKEKTSLVNVDFWYQVQEDPPNPGEKIDVEIVVTSNEYEDPNGRKMYKIIERRDLGGPPAPVHRATLLLAPFTCRDEKVDSAKNSCLVEEFGTARFYDIGVVATDTSGNKDDVTCTVVAVPEYIPSKSSKKSKKGARGGTDDRQSRGLSPAKGKGKGAPPPLRPTRKELILDTNPSTNLWKRKKWKKRNKRNETANSNSSTKNRKKRKKRKKTANSNSSTKNPSTNV
eukprot:jgi/Psemu1/3057/gm1.3057_g